MTCQTCHQHYIETFATDHPEFKQYLAGFKRHIHFDHLKHINKHFNARKFAEVKKPGCQDCHGFTNQKRDMGIVSYQASCAACHEQQINGESAAEAKGIPFLLFLGLMLPA